MRKFLLFLLLPFLLFKGEIHNFSHHIREYHHKHRLECLFSHDEKKEVGINEACLFHDLFIVQNSVLGLDFFALKSPQIITIVFVHFDVPQKEKLDLSFLPNSRGPPALS